MNEEMKEVMAGTSPTNGGEQGDRDVDNFVVSNTPEMGDGRTESAPKCQSCGYTQCECK